MKVGERKSLPRYSAVLRLAGGGMPPRWASAVMLLSNSVHLRGC